MNKPAGAHIGALDGLLGTAHVVEAHVESRLAPLGLSLPKLAALAAIRDAGESIALSQLAERLACVKSNITQLIDRLEADGFVRRAADPNDRRSRLAVLTTAGRVAVESGTRVREEVERELLSGLDESDTRQLSALVQRILQRVV